MGPFPAYIVPLTLVLSWLLLVCPMMWAMGWITGWRHLAARFPARPIGEDATRGWAGTIFLGKAGYKRCLIWAADADYLHLRIWPIFAGLGHHPMSIPWAAIEFTGEMRRWVRVVIDGHTPGRLPRQMVEGELRVRKAVGELTARG